MIAYDKYKSIAPFKLISEKEYYAKIRGIEKVKEYTFFDEGYMSILKEKNVNMIIVKIEIDKTKKKYFLETEYSDLEKMVSDIENLYREYLTSMYSNFVEKKIRDLSGYAYVYEKYIGQTPETRNVRRPIEEEYERRKNNPDSYDGSEWNDDDYEHYAGRYWH